MKRIWSVVLILLALAWGAMTPAAAEKIEHFKDNQGTLHITNVKPEEQAKPGATPSGPAPLKVQAHHSPSGGIPAPQSESVEGPETGPEPEAPQAEAPPEAETQPNSG
jgi:hypothetical protein